MNIKKKKKAALKGAWHAHMHLRIDNNRVNEISFALLSMISVSYGRERKRKLCLSEEID